MKNEAGEIYVKMGKGYGRKICWKRYRLDPVMIVVMDRTDEIYMRY